MAGPHQVSVSLPVEPCASGATLLAVRHALERLVGADVVALAVASLPRDVSDEFDTMTPLSWVRLTALSRVVDAASRLSGWDAERLYDTATRQGVEESFRTLWKVLLHFTSDEALLARVPLIYAKSRNVGALSAHASAPDRAVMRVAGWPGMDDRAMRSIGISLQATLEFVGRRSVRGSWTRTADGAIYQFRWQLLGSRPAEPGAAERKPGGPASSVRPTRLRAGVKAGGRAGVI